MIQRGVAGSEIVQGDPDSKLLDLSEDSLHLFHVINCEAFCYLQCQIVRFYSGVGNCFSDTFHNIIL